MFLRFIILISERDTQNSSYLSHGVRQNLNDLLVRRRHDALAVDLDDAVTDADASSLGDASPHQAADLRTHTHMTLQTRVDSKWHKESCGRG